MKSRMRDLPRQTGGRTIPLKRPGDRQANKRLIAR
jgi:hypothetical protein